MKKVKAQAFVFGNLVTVEFEIQNSATIQQINAKAVEEIRHHAIQILGSNIILRSAEIIK